MCESSISTVYTQQFRFCFIMSKIASTSEKRKLAFWLFRVPKVFEALPQRSLSIPLPFVDIAKVGHKKSPGNYCRSIRMFFRRFRRFFRTFRNYFRRSKSAFPNFIICSITPSSFHFPILPESFPLTMGF